MCIFYGHLLEEYRRVSGQVSSCPPQVNCPVYLLLFISIFLLPFITFCSVLFNLLCSIIQCLITWLFSVIFCSDTGIVFQVFRSYKSSKTTILQVDKHHTTDCTIFCFSIRVKGLLPSQTLVGYPEPISPIGLAVCKTIKILCSSLAWRASSSSRASSPSVREHWSSSSPSSLVVECC
jgi:hypothetical protein